MATVPKPVLVLKPIYQAQGGLMSNTTFWVADTPPTSQTQMDTLADGASAAFAAVYLPVLSGEANFLGLTAIYYSGSTVLEATSTSGAGNGASGGNLLPDQCAVVIDKQTGMYGRQYLGRYFIGGLDNDVLSTTNSNEIDTTAPNYGAMQNLAAFLGADRDFGASNCHARHWDRKSNSLVPVTKCTVRSRIASQRKRRKRQVDFIYST